MSSDALTDFLRALRDDLTDRRLLPLVGIVCAGLLAAIVFVVAGGSSAPSTPASPPSGPVAKAGLPVSEATNGTKQAVAETVNGSADQHAGGSRNPFEPLPSAITATLTTSAPAGKPASGGSGSSSSSSSGGGSSSSGSGASGPTPTPAAKTEPPKPVTPPKEKTVIHYTVSVEFGQLPAGGAPPQLKPYPALKLDEPLPAANPQLAYLGVTLRTGRYAVFALTGEAILHGAGKCVPSVTHCQAVELAAGQLETLETFDATGQPANYELKVVSIARSLTTASGASVSSAGSQLLQSSSTLPIDGVSYSQSGVLATAVR